MNKVCVFTAVE